MFKNRDNRELEKQDPDEGMTKVAVALLKQNVLQGQLIKQCTQRIAELEAKMICDEHKVKQPRSKNGVLQFFFKKEVL